MPGQIPTHVFTIMCEDIRGEERGKISLLGVYSENIYFKEHPMRMRSLAFYNRFAGGRGTFSVTAKLRSLSAELLKPLEIKEIAFPKSKDSEFTHLGIGFSPAEFKEEGLHEYQLYFDDIPDPIVRIPFGVYLKPDIFGDS